VINVSLYLYRWKQLSNQLKTLENEKIIPNKKNY
jgi:hypothetical protein